MTSDCKDCNTLTIHYEANRWWVNHEPFATEAEAKAYAKGYCLAWENVFYYLREHRPEKVIAQTVTTVDYKD